MDIEITKSGDKAVVAIKGRLDTTNYNELDDKLAEILDNDGDKILLDLSEMEYISSSGLRILLMYLKKIKAMNGRFMLSGMTPGVREIFEISGFINIFEVFDDRDAALNE